MNSGKKVFKKIGDRLLALKVDGFIVFNEKDLQYLLGFSSEGSLLLFSRKNNPVYFINQMNYTLAKKHLKETSGCEVFSFSGSLFNAVNEYCNKKNLRKIAFNPQDVSVMLYEKMRKMFKKKLIPVARAERFVDIISEIRQIKTDREVEILSLAGRKTVGIWRKARKNINVGLSEKAIALILNDIIKDAGYTNSFPTIVASGKNSAYPHAIPTLRKLKNGEHLLVDFGICFKGYCSDLTRTLDKGRINRQIMDFRKFVLQARDIAIKKIKPGISIAAVVEQVNEFFMKNGVSEYILHGLGHGVGLNVHESPFLSISNCDRFKKNMVITIEPGLYKEGVGGIREEDMVLVTEKGCEVLTI